MGERHVTASLRHRVATPVDDIVDEDFMDTSDIGVEGTEVTITGPDASNLFAVTVNTNNESDYFIDLDPSPIQIYHCV